MSIWHSGNFVGSATCELFAIWLFLRYGQSVDVLWVDCENAVNYVNGTLPIISDEGLKLRPLIQACRLLKAQQPNLRIIQRSRVHNMAAHKAAEKRRESVEIHGGGWVDNPFIPDEMDLVLNVVEQYTRLVCARPKKPTKVTLRNRLGYRSWPVSADGLPCVSTRHYLPQNIEDYPGRVGDKNTIAMPENLNLTLREVLTSQQLSKMKEEVGGGRVRRQRHIRRRPPRPGTAFGVRRAGGRIPGKLER